MSGASDTLGGGRRLSGAALLDAFETLKQDKPGLRARDAAGELGVSEAELVACRTGNGITRLRPEFGEILKAMPALGRVMVLTRNEHCVHEKYGTFGQISIGSDSGIVLNHDIDLRLFLNHWKHGFAVTENVASGLRSSLQFFGADGEAVHKIYVTKVSDSVAYEGLVARFASSETGKALDVAPLPESDADRPDGEIDVEGLRRSWRDLQDTHEFFGMLKTFGINRAQAMRLAEPEFAYRVAPEALRQTLETAASSRTSIMCFVGNRGCIQIHTGPVRTLKTMGPWYNVLDPGFNLHLREDAIRKAWVVRKPTKDGIVTSLELFDANGFCFVQFFGERKPGNPELEPWREIVAALPRWEQEGVSA